MNKSEFYELIFTVLQNIQFPKSKNTETSSTISSSLATTTTLSNDNINNLFQYLVSAIILESETFINDLEATDDTLSMKLCKQQAKLQSLSTNNSTSPTLTSTPISSPSIDSPIVGVDIGVGIGTVGTESRNNVRNNEKKLTNSQFPLDELIISTHIILFLISFLRFLTQYEKENEIENPHSIKILSTIQQLFPRGTWWLPKRILMAYLAIQDEVNHFILYYIIFSFII